MLTDYLVPRGYGFAAPFDFRRGFDRFFSEPSADSRGFSPFAACESCSSPGVWETPDEYFVEVAAPGLAQEAVDVTLAGSELTIVLQREKKAEAAEKQGRYWRRERSQGASTFVVSFPSAVDAERVEARLERGVLLVQIPKREKARVKKIEINKTTTLETDVVQPNANNAKRLNTGDVQ
ncbi:MAG: Hsp20/alpha crystallin family protein [Thermoguttaceae bacterium]|nr:Hsp20/alpha crystallin family protein [Thermoguttaceae bacterium]